MSSDKFKHGGFIVPYGIQASVMVNVANHTGGIIRFKREVDYAMDTTLKEIELREHLRKKFKHFYPKRFYMTSGIESGQYVINFDRKYTRDVGQNRLLKSVTEFMDGIVPLEKDKSKIEEYDHGWNSKSVKITLQGKNIAISAEQYKALEKNGELF